MKTLTKEIRFLLHGIQHLVGRVRAPLVTTVLASGIAHSAAGASPPSLDWALRVGAPGWQAGNSLAATTNGDVYVVGGFQGVVDFDPGPGTILLTNGGAMDGFLAKYNSAGQLVWVRHLTPNTGDESAFTLALDPEENVVAGMRVGLEAIVWKFDRDGASLWNVRIPHEGGSSSTLAVDGAGNIYMTAAFAGTKDFDPGPGISQLVSAGFLDAFVLKLDADGNYLWARRMGGSLDERGLGLAVDASGHVFVVGYMEGSGYYGSILLSPAGGRDGFIAALDGSGHFLWAHPIGGTYRDEAPAVRADGAGNVYVAGYYRGHVDFDPGPGTQYLDGAGGLDGFVLKLTDAGEFVWARSIGGSADEGIDYMALDQSGSPVLTGVMFGNGDYDPGPGTHVLTNAGAYSTFVVRLNRAGDFVWAGQLSASLRLAPYALATDAGGHVYVTGYFAGTADFDPGTNVFSLTSDGGEGADDLYLVKWSDTSRPTVTHLTISPVDPVISTLETVRFQAWAEFSDGSEGMLSVPTWVPVNALGTPPARRSDCGYAYDPVSNRLMIFGGRPTGCTFDVNFNDSWVLTNANGVGVSGWVRLSSAGTPPSVRAGHSAVYSQRSSRLIVFGGDPNCATTKYNDVWVLSNANGLGSSSWMQLQPVGNPPSARSHHVVGYDEANNRMIIWGGFSGSANLDDAWVLTHADGADGTPEWIPLDPGTTKPVARFDAAGAYDPQSNRMIVFGGWPCCVGGAAFYNDTWVLLNANGLGGAPQWIELNPTGTLPSPRGTRAAYDPATDELLIFGGYASDAARDNSVWVLSNADGVAGTPEWRPSPMSGTPPVGRERVALTYDPGSRRLTLFGGDGPFGTPDTTNDVWVLLEAPGRDSGLTWTSSAPAVATVGQDGSATPTGQGYTTICACKDGVCGCTMLFVTNQPPTVVKPPLNLSVRQGSNVTWCVAVNGSRPLTYQWRFNSTNIVDATNRCLTVANAGLDNAGLYSLVSANPFGTNTLQAALSLVDLQMFAGLIIAGPPGNYRIEALDNLDGTNTWKILDLRSVSQEQMPFYFFDTNSPSMARRFYRSIWLP